MQLHHKVKILRQLSNRTHDHMGGQMNMSGSAFGKIERCETRPDHERTGQMAVVFNTSPETLTNGKDLYLRIYQTEKGEVAFEILPENNQLLERNTQLEEEVKHLRNINAGLQDLNDRQKDFMDKQDNQKNKRKKR